MQVLKSVAMEMFKVKNGARPGQRNIFILFTSGKSTGTQPLQPTAKQLPEIGVTTYVIGTSDKVDRDEVSTIAPGNKDGVYFVDGSTSISGVVSRIIMKILNRGSIGMTKFEPSLSS